MSANIAGSLLLAVPAIVVAWLVLWQRARPVFWSTLAMILIATGYLNATGAAREIGSSLIDPPIRTKAR